MSTFSASSASPSSAQINTSPVPSKCLIVAAIVSTVAGVVLVALGGLNIFGPVGSVGFLASIAAGSILISIVTGGILKVCATNDQRQKQLQHSSPAPHPTISFNSSQVSQHPKDVLTAEELIMRYANAFMSEHCYPDKGPIVAYIDIFDEQTGGTSQFILDFNQKLPHLASLTQLSLTIALLNEAFTALKTKGSILDFEKPTKNSAFFKVTVKD